MNVKYLQWLACVLEKAIAPHSSTLAWQIPWMEEPGRLQSMASWRVGHDWATSLSLFTFMHWRRKWQPTPVFLPGESQGWGTWWAAVYGVTQSQTQLKWLSSSRCLRFIDCLDWLRVLNIVYTNIIKMYLHPVCFGYRLVMKSGKNIEWIKAKGTYRTKEFRFDLRSAKNSF